MFLNGFLCVGIGGLVGVGKIIFIDWLCKVMCDIYLLVVIINDIYISEDVEVLMCSQVLISDCIWGVEIGGCLYMVIWEDVLINLVVVKDLSDSILDLDLILIELGGDNLVVIFLLELVDLIIYVIDVVVGEEIFWKGGLGIMWFDLFVINKIDFVFYVGVDLDVMNWDVVKMCKVCLFVFVNIRVGKGIEIVVDFIVEKGGFEV